jgi:uncharacterized protein (DUF1684 family)
MSLSLLDWRRRVARLYGEIRGADDIRAAHELWRTTRDELLAHHPDSPLTPDARADFTGLPVAPYDDAFRFELEVDLDVAPMHLDVETGTDGIVPFDRFGVVHLPGVGDLDVWWIASYGGGVFVPVRDATAGTTTYGGGRYVLDTIKGADLGGENGRLIVDFNFAYNPSCAYDPQWVCPLAPPGNTVDVPIVAGELFA